MAPGEGTGATMSDDDEDHYDSETNLFDGSLDGQDSMGFGPLVPTESERTLMERVRQELKHELKQVCTPLQTLHRMYLLQLIYFRICRVTRRRSWISERKFCVKEEQENFLVIPLLS